jgi:hypothetical protein
MLKRQLLVDNFNMGAAYPVASSMVSMSLRGWFITTIWLKLCCYSLSVLFRWALAKTTRTCLELQRWGDKTQRNRNCTDSYVHWSLDWGHDHLVYSVSTKVSLLHLYQAITHQTKLHPAARLTATQEVRASLARDWNDFKDKCVLSKLTSSHDYVGYTPIWKQ